MARHWQTLRPTSDLWGAGSWGNITALTARNAPRGIYQITATPIVRADASTWARHRILVGGGNLSGDMPYTVTPLNASLPLTVGHYHAGGDLTVNSQVRCATNAQAGQGSRLDVFYLGPEGS